MADKTKHGKQKKPKKSRDKWVNTGTVSSTPQWLSLLEETLKKKEFYRKYAGQERRCPDEENLKDSAVLVHITGDPHHIPTKKVPYPEDAAILLTHRKATLRSHSGDIAFPGGKRDKEDRTSVDTALREACEETGLESSDVQPIAVWQPMYIPVTSYAVVPVISYSPQRLPVHCASQDEVDWVGYVAVKDLLSPQNYIELTSVQYSGPGFWVYNYLCWGFSAQVLQILFQRNRWLPTGTKAFVPERVDLFDALEQADNHTVQEGKNG